MSRIVRSSFVLLLCFVSLASAPENGWGPAVEVVGQPLTVTWQKPEDRPRTVAWVPQGSELAQPYQVLSGQDQVVMERKSINALPSQLLVVPQDNTLKPMIIEIDEQEEEVTLSFEKVPNNEVWFWGFLPASPCSMTGREGALSVSVRLIHKTKVYQSFNSAFVWHIALDAQDKYEIPFYFTADINDALSAVTVDGFRPANDISQAMCHVHHGGECSLTLETNKDVWGKSHQIMFEKESSFFQGGCPI